MANLAVVILTYNEELHIARALNSVRGFARELFVVDSFSQDRTVDLARQFGATIFQHKFETQSAQLDWALQHITMQSEWIMRLDADEVIAPDLAESIEVRLQQLPSDVCGVNLMRKHIFMGRWIRFGGRYPLILLRIWRRGTARVENRWMDEHMLLTCGRTVTFHGGFSDYNLHGLTHFTNKHNSYATREAIDILCERHNFVPTRLSLESNRASTQAAVKRMIKVNVYNRLPFWLSAPLYFIFRYVVQFGFLDGIEGLIYHFLQGCWYRFLVGAKVLEYERALAGLTKESDIVTRLSEMTGYSVNSNVQSAGKE